MYPYQFQHLAEQQQQYNEMMWAQQQQQHQGAADFGYAQDDHYGQEYDDYDDEEEIFLDDEAEKFYDEFLAKLQSEKANSSPKPKEPEEDEFLRDFDKFHKSEQEDLAREPSETTFYNGTASQAQNSSDTSLVNDFANLTTKDTH